MKRLCVAWVVLVLLAAPVFGQTGIPTVSAGEAARARSAVTTFVMYKDPPPLVVDGWEKARLATLDYGQGIKTDIYWPAEIQSKPLPIVLVAFSYTTAQFVEESGLPYREYLATTIWMAQLANRGFVVVCPDIESTGGDSARIMTWLQANGQKLGADSSRLGLLATSANPKIIPYMMTLPEAKAVKAIALYYPEIIPASWQAFPNVALYILKAGQDVPSRNLRTDAVAQKFRDAGNYVEVVTYENGRHAFDLRERSPEAAAAMATTLDFFAAHL
jgi:hypothetical protein